MSCNLAAMVPALQWVLIDTLVLRVRRCGDLVLLRSFSIASTCEFCFSTVEYYVLDSLRLQRPLGLYGFNRSFQLLLI